ncbi:hypothetical protein SprV_0100513000 [Sparganum proliferum]
MADSFKSVHLQPTCRLVCGDAPNPTKLVRLPTCKKHQCVAGVARRFTCASIVEHDFVASVSVESLKAQWRKLDIVQYVIRRNVQALGSSDPHLLFVKKSWAELKRNGQLRAAPERSKREQCHN